MTDRILAEAARRIDEERRIEATALLDGLDDDFVNYKKRVGMVQGLNKALQILEEYQRDLNKNGTGTNS